MYIGIYGIYMECLGSHIHRMAPHIRAGSKRFEGSERTCPLKRAEQLGVLETYVLRDKELKSICWSSASPSDGYPENSSSLTQ